MSLTKRLDALDRVHRSIRNAAALLNEFRPDADLAVHVTDDGRLHHAPASSVAVQALAAKPSLVTTALSEVQDQLRRALPVLEGRTMWQAAGTLHLNVVILRRLSRATLPPAERARCLADAMAWLDGSRLLRPYTVRFAGIAVTPSGALIALGAPTCETPWLLREEIAGRGYADQQTIFHVTLARVLSPLSSRAWRSVVAYTGGGAATQLIADWTITQAILIVEREGYLHNPSAYEIVRHVEFSRGPTP